ncbi:Oidioi.mRNA.OKI2018_I69.XSR.g15963.t1.cds [Oikopleura dioica]|uniref:Oidioi.mRNA.OKI2018_I69.XSR.g15963.t1.cds n=1 Tax=Oikopleura dioica TaxID=34765 RepID=A0ABN7SKX2_OIKDI|nr:Oidioi.mRNA.OKI2018_I69.XSR.g15963.t1.cds [Oikopleura dioica]
MCSDITYFEFSNFCKTATLSLSKEESKNKVAFPNEEEQMRTRSQRRSLEASSQSEQPQSEQIAAAAPVSQDEAEVVPPVEQPRQMATKSVSARNRTKVNKKQILDLDAIDSPSTSSCNSSANSSGIICISDSEESGELPVCVDLTNTNNKNQRAKKRPSLSQTVISIDDSDEEEDRAPAANGGRQNEPQKKPSPKAPVKAARKRPKIVLKELIPLTNQPDSRNAPPPPPADIGFSCNICMETMAEIRSSGKKIVTTPCGHPFCRPCLEMAACSVYGRMPGPNQVVNHCPKCRKKYSLRQLIELFV